MMTNICIDIKFYSPNHLPIYYNTNNDIYIAAMSLSHITAGTYGPLTMSLSPQ